MAVKASLSEDNNDSNQRGGGGGGGRGYRGPPFFLVFLKNRFKVCLPKPFKMFGHKCSQNDVKRDLHECEFFIGMGWGGGGGLRSRHNFFGPLFLYFLDPPLVIIKVLLALYMSQLCKRVNMAASFTGFSI